MRWLASGIIFLLLPAGARHRDAPAPQRAGGRPVARMPEEPGRAAWQKPEEVIEALALRADETVADIGAGSGYFTRRFAARTGRVYAVDINPKLLEQIAALGLANVTTVLADPDDPRLPGASVDTVFFCNVLHHIRNRPAYFAKISRALKPGGRIVIIDFHKRPLPVGPPVSGKLSGEEVISELDGVGFRLDRSHGMLDYQYFFEFRRR